MSFFVSERVVEDLRALKVELLEVTEFPIESIEAGSKLRLSDAPRYFVAEAPPEIEPDWAAMGIPLGADGKLANSRQRIPTPVIYRKDTWPGRDLVSHVGITQWLFCSERVKLFGERKWSNVRFERIGAHRIGGKA